MPSYHRRTPRATGLVFGGKVMVTIVTIAILLVGSVLLGLSDTRISIADTSIPDNEVASSG